jgi:predicted metalloprotease with PDZ domain
MSVACRWCHALVVLAARLAAQPLDVPAAQPRPGVGPLRATAPAYAIAYGVAMPDPASHLYDITLDVAAPAGRTLGDTLALVLPVWSPGRYARMDFARNVQGFAAASDGAPLRWTKRGGSTWLVAARGARRVAVRYRVFANTLDGTFSVLDTAHANWNGAGLFMYVAGHKPDPVRLVVTPPAGWTVVNGVLPARGNGGAQTRTDSAGGVTFAFPNYDELVDTPTEVAPAGALTVDSVTVDGRLYRIMVHHNGPRPEGARERFVRQVRAVVERENRVVAPPPLRAYTFLFNIGYAGRDGMEHLYSTSIIRPEVWTADTTALMPGIALASHEYFHTWSSKRLRPAALGPFDYTEAQHQPSLWVVEGWTNYYGRMTLARTGIVGRRLFLTDLARLVQAMATSPARLERSPRQASYDAPFFDGAAVPMATNEDATFATYYTSGEVRALALDLMIRAATDGARSLDDVLRRLKADTWDAPATTYYLPGRGYTERDVERAASAVIGRDLHDWFARHAGGTEDLPWAALFRPLGLALDTSGATWTLVEDPHAIAAQQRLRDGWLR